MPYLSSIALAEEYEKAYGICNHSPTGSKLQSVAQHPAERVEPNTQLYMYINRFIDLEVSKTVPNLTLSEFLSYPREIVEELLRKCRERIERQLRLEAHAETKSKIRGNRK